AMLVGTIAAGVLVVVASSHLLSQAFAISAWEGGLISFAVLALAAAALYVGGPAALIPLAPPPPVFAAGGLLAGELSKILSPAGKAWPQWTVWSIYAGGYALLYMTLPALLVWLRGGPRDPARFQAIRDEAEEAHMRREADLVLLPSHNWYLLSSWV